MNSTRPYYGFENHQGHDLPLSDDENHWARLFMEMVNNQEDGYMFIIKCFRLTSMAPSFIPQCKLGLPSGDHSTEKKYGSDLISIKFYEDILNRKNRRIRRCQKVKVEFE